MEISHPRRILAVSTPDSSLIDLIKNLTGTPPSITTTIAGTSHTLPLSTPYYSASIPIWLDEISTPAQWASEFLAPEAKEVLAVLGAYIVCFRRPVDEAGLQEVRALLEGVQRVVKGGGYAWDGVCLAVAMPQSIAPALEMGHEEWEEVCEGFGFEFVDSQGMGRNEYSEKVGMERLKEALEANDWEASAELDDLGFEDFEDDGEDTESLGFGAEAAELEMEMVGMKQAIHGGTQDKEEDGGRDEDVEQLQAMMLRLQAVKDLGADMPEMERKKFAAKAVGDIMKTM